MNLHEECLLKYLLNPMNLISTTEELKANNFLVEKVFLRKISAKNIKLKCTRN